MPEIFPCSVSVAPVKGGLYLNAIKDLQCGSDGNELVVACIGGQPCKRRAVKYRIVLGSTESSW